MRGVSEEGRHSVVLGVKGLYLVLMQGEGEGGIESLLLVGAGGIGGRCRRVCCRLRLGIKSTGPLGASTQGWVDM